MGSQAFFLDRMSGMLHFSAENAMHWVQESWISCRFKRLVAASAATIFWNVFSLRTRIFTGNLNETAAKKIFFAV